ncbi:hypothetical protein AB0D08_27195 [Kitasatospora sp. NPDC048540]|uniref:hypothetical protein n=1 Tax=unclassified Kitasatospora TaxID=2633591 RepID=UPI0005399F3D|nr:hypothetical protein [Kitasatospora sp. MBT63]
MATHQRFTDGFNVNRSMLTTGALLTGFGAMLGLAGAVIVGVSLAQAGRDFVRQMDTPPTELASRAMHHARAASMAGLDAWRAEAGNGSMR